MSDWLYEISLTALYLAIAILVVGATEFGNWIGRRSHGPKAVDADIGTLAGATLGLLALLLGFSFSIALSRYDGRRDLVLEEANAIGSTANFALMLPEPVQGPTLDLLREYAEVRVTLGTPYDPLKMEQDIARSLDLQTRLWQQAVAVTAASPQSLPVYRFVASLNEMNNIHERRLTALRYHVQAEIFFMLLGVAMVAMVLTGYQVGATRGRRHPANLLMAFTVAMVMTLIIDLDRPHRGLILVPVQPLLDAAAGIKP